MTASFWNANNTTTDFCFIDLIKGIVPLDLFVLANKITNNTSLTIPLLSHIYHFIFTSILKIWKDRCDHFANAEKLANITQLDKRKNWLTSGFPQSIPNFSSSLPSSFISSFRYGNDWSNFWTSSNHALLSGWSSFLFS